MDNTRQTSNGVKRIYLDNSASTPVDERVLKEMLPYFSEKYGNASASHFFGRETQQALGEARLKAAKFLNCDASEVVFTGSATEASNLAILGIVNKAKLKDKEKKPHVIVSSIEHESVLEIINYLKDIGEIEATFLPVSESGFVLIDSLKSSLTDQTVIVSVMHANNEVGTIQPVKEISGIIKNFNKEKNKEILFHTDASQSANFLDCNIKELEVDLLTISTHKIYGPKGVGVLFVKKGVSLEPMVLGSKQEWGLRSGTENVPAIVGTGKALELVTEKRDSLEKIKVLRDDLAEYIINEIPGTKINGDMKNRVHHNLNVSFKGIDKADLIAELDLVGVAVSGGAACYSKSERPSHVLRALNIPEGEINSSIRISLGRHTTKEDVDYVLSSLKDIVRKLRG